MYLILLMEEVYRTKANNALMLQSFEILSFNAKRNETPNI